MNSFKYSWDDFERLIDQMFSKVFEGIDYKELSFLERRKKIFNYLYLNVEYDLEELKRIRSDVISTDNQEEIMDVLKNFRGVCNAIAQVYKMLLEKAGIYSLCICCNDESLGHPEPHQLVLVDSGGFMSFDDPTMAIYNRCFLNSRKSADDYFGYDLEFAMKSNKQGLTEVYGQKWILLPTELIYVYFGRDDKYYRNIIPDYVDERNLPSNIASISDEEKDFLRRR